jgi:hypothetical protein
MKYLEVYTPVSECFYNAICFSIQASFSLSKSILLKTIDHTTPLWSPYSFPFTLHQFAWGDFLTQVFVCRVDILIFMICVPFFSVLVFHCLFYRQVVRVLIFHEIAFLVIGTFSFSQKVDSNNFTSSNHSIHDQCTFPDWVSHKALKLSLSKRYHYFNSIFFTLESFHYENSTSKPFCRIWFSKLMNIGSLPVVHKLNIFNFVHYVTFDSFIVFFD